MPSVHHEFDQPEMPEWKRYYRDQLREGRQAAIRNSEDFYGLLFAIERLGFYLHRSEGDLGAYKPEIVDLATRSPLYRTGDAPGLEIPFERLYDLVRRSRNDALHQGASARILTRHAVELALILEDALMERENEASQLADAIGVGGPSEGKVRDFMVPNPVGAALWQPLSLIRQTMLTDSFSYLPVFDDRPGREGRWMLVSDRRLAQYLRVDYPTRRKRLAMPLLEAIKEDGFPGSLQLEKAHHVQADSPIADVFNGNDNGRPVLVFRSKASGSPLVGLIMPFDVL